MEHANKTKTNKKVQQEWVNFHTNFPKSEVIQYIVVKFQVKTF